MNKKIENTTDTTNTYTHISRASTVAASVDVVNQNEAVCLFVRACRRATHKEIAQIVKIYVCPLLMLLRCVEHNESCTERE